MMTFREAEDAYYEYIANARKQLTIQFNDILKDNDLYNVDVIRKKDNKKGRLKACWHGCGRLLDISFFPYTQNGQLSYKSSGSIQRDIEYIKQSFERVKE